MTGRSSPRPWADRDTRESGSCGTRAVGSTRCPTTRAVEMPTGPQERPWPGLDEVVEAFESALATNGSAEVADHAPDPQHPDRLAILCELIRVDLESRWGRGRPRRLEDYREPFPGP